jgi:hypothetical protein
MNKKYRENNKYENLKENIGRKNYDEINRYDFYKKYYMHIAIGTKFEDCIEITKKDYKDLRRKINNSKKAMIRVFTTYKVGFYKNPETYVLQSVDKDVYYCLYKSQRYEKNKRRHERERHLDKFFKQEDISNIASKTNLENDVLEGIDEKRVKEFLKETLSKKQNDRFYKNKILDIPLVVIAIEEGSTPDAVRDSVNKAKKQLKKNLKNL